MPRCRLAEFANRDFDVVVIGAGVNGASAAQHLAAAGYSVLLVDKGDFASGSSSRSGRLLHCGLRYLEPGEGLAYQVSQASPIRHFMRHPGQFLAGCRRAREAMQCRSQFVKSMPERLKAKTYFVPVYTDGKYKPWHVALAFRFLAMLGPGMCPWITGG